MAQTGCLRCGYRCNRLMVVIVSDPEILGDRDDFISGDQDNFEVHSGAGPGPDPCKYLRGDRPGEFSCILHDKPWYHATSCYQYQYQRAGNQVHCRMGLFVFEKLEEPSDNNDWKWWK